MLSQVAFLAAHRAAWEVDILEKKRLSVMMDEKAAFQVGCLAPVEKAHGNDCTLTKSFFQLVFEKTECVRAFWVYTSTCERVIHQCLTISLP